MKRRWDKKKQAVMVVLCLLTLLPTLANALTSSQIFDKAKGSIVVVKVLDSKGEVKGLGSGVLLPSGKIATNSHVVEGGKAFRVDIGEKFFTATLYSQDLEKDLCLLDAKVIGIMLKIHADSQDDTSGVYIKPAELGKASSLKVGDRVYAVGSPYGLELSLSDGIVSQLRGGTPPIIQTTVAISPGSSGGGLFDGKGRLVGFTTFYLEGGQSLNFAIPVEWIADVKPGRTAAQRPTPKKGWLYVEAEPKNARIRIMNIRPVFQQGIELSPGSYHVEVSAGGYETKNVWTKLEPGEHKRLTISLELSRLEAYRQAVRINPESPFAWQGLVISHYLSGNRRAAMDAFRELRRLDPAMADLTFYAILPP